MLKNKGLYSNIVALAREDEREYRIVNGKNSDVLTQRWYYRLFSWLKIIALAVLLVMAGSFIIGAVNELSALDSYTASAEEIALSAAELKQAILVVSSAVAAVAVGFVFTLLKKGDNTRPFLNITGAVIVLASCAVMLVFLYFAVRNSDNYYDGGMTRFIWRFVVPAAALACCALVQAVYGAVETGADKARYEAVLKEAFEKFTEDKQGGTYTEQEWEDFVRSYKRAPVGNPVNNKSKKRSAKG